MVAHASSFLQKYTDITRDRVEETLSAVFSVLDRKDEDAGRRIREFVDLPDPQSIIPAISACSKHLRREYTGRVKSVEFLFEGAIARQIRQHPDVIPELLEYIVSNPIDSGIVRYWWQAMSAAIKAGSEEVKQYFEHPHEISTDDDFILWAYVQLMFLRDGPGASKKIKQWARQVLEELAQDAPTYLDAQNMVERLRSGGGGNSPTRKNLGVTSI
ncbi:MAG: hypothetical protein WHX52_20815 [Anaerolineae bacterium]